MDDTVEFISKGDAGIHLKNRMGTYTLSNQMSQGFPVFEQAKNEEEEEKYFLFVCVDGEWIVSPDITDITATGTGTVLRHPKVSPTPKLPPKTGWQYRSGGWIKDDSLEAVVKVRESSRKQQNLPYLPYHTATLTHSQQVLDIAISKNNQFIYTGGEGGYIKVWDLNQPPNQMSPNLRGYTTPVIQLNFDEAYGISLKMVPDGNSLVVGGDSCIIHVLDLTGPYPTFKSQLESSCCSFCIGFSFSPDGRLCYSCYMEGTTIEVWDIHNEILVGRFEGHTGTVSRIDMSGDGNKLWSGGEDKTVRMWDPRVFSQLQQHELNRDVMALACCPTDDWVAVGTGESNVEFFHSSKPDKEKLELETGNVMSLKFANSGKWLMASGTGIFGCTPPLSPTKIFTVFESAACCAISSDDSYMAIGSFNDEGYKDEGLAQVYRVEYYSTKQEYIASN